MALVIVLGVLGLGLAVLGLLSRLDMSNEVRLAFNVIGGLGVLVFPIYVYSVIDLKLTGAAVARIGREWCAGSNVEFVRTEQHKNHFSVLYRTGVSSKSERQNFRVRFVPTTWFVKAVEWL